jgi:hypothetical protein
MRPRATSAKQIKDDKSKGFIAVIPSKIFLKPENAIINRLGESKGAIESSRALQITRSKS